MSGRRLMTERESEIGFAAAGMVAETDVGLPHP